jgi:hypothetical protein
MRYVAQATLIGRAGKPLSEPGIQTRLAGNPVHDSFLVREAVQDWRREVEELRNLTVRFLRSLTFRPPFIPDPNGPDVSGHDVAPEISHGRID